MVRKAITKKARFDIFKRDLFTCQYCGRTPPTVVLEIDHIKPVSKGGCNSIDNLMTACFDCNRGKSSELLTEAPTTISNKAEILLEKREQLKAFERLIKSEARRLTKNLDKISEIFSEATGYSLTEKSKNSIRLQFLKNLPFHEIEEAMELSLHKFSFDSLDPEEIPHEVANDIYRYFCGVCWRKIKGGYRNAG